MFYPYFKPPLPPCQVHYLEKAKKYAKELNKYQQAMEQSDWFVAELGNYEKDILESYERNEWESVKNLPQKNLNMLNMRKIRF